MNAAPYRIPSPAEFSKRLAEFNEERRLRELARLSDVPYDRLWQIVKRVKRPLLEHCYTLWPIMDAMDAADAAAAAARREVMGQFEAKAASESRLSPAA